jgi:hypothetical protein
MHEAWSSTPPTRNATFRSYPAQSEGNVSVYHNLRVSFLLALRRPHSMDRGKEVRYNFYSRLNRRCVQIRLLIRRTRVTCSEEPFGVMSHIAAPPPITLGGGRKFKVERGCTVRGDKEMTSSRCGSYYLVLYSKCDFEVLNMTGWWDRGIRGFALE